MAKKKSTTPKAARARTAPAAEAPQPTPVPTGAAPVPQSAMLEPPGFRTPELWSRHGGMPRPVGPLTRTATLVRGQNYFLSYAGGPVVFKKGRPVPINESEFARLMAAVDFVDFLDPSTNVRIRRSIYKFTFADADTGEAIAMPAILDEECGPYARSAGDQAEYDRRFEGQEHTRR